MKSKTVEGVFIIVVVAAILLLLPFFVPYEEGQRGLGAGQYSIGEEEEPETFMRIIERVGSFYGIKHRKKGTVYATMDMTAPNETKKSTVASLDSNKGTLSAHRDFKQNNQKNLFDSAQSVITVNSNSDSNISKKVSVREVYNNKTEKELLEYNDKIYTVEPDSYGNKYIITDKGPIAVDDVLKRGGNLLNNETKTVQGRYSNHYGNRDFTAANRNWEHPKKSGNDNISKYKNNKISGFGNGKIKPFSSGGKSKEGAGRSFAGNSGGKSFGNYNFTSAQDFENLANTLHANTGNSSSSSPKANNTTKKIYSLQNTEPSVGENPKGISIEDNNNSNITSNSDDLGWGDVLSGNSVSKTDTEDAITITLSEDYRKSDGILPESKSMRSIMTKELLNGKTYTANTKQGKEDNPWILPNEVKYNEPGQSFYEINEKALANGTFDKRDWQESDRYYIKSKIDIEETSGGKPIPVVIIDGQKNAFTMNTMAKDTFYYKTTSGLLSGNIIDAAKNGGVDISSIDKNNVLVIVPEKSLADNLRKDGYKVALFDQYIITPPRLKKFYGQTVLAVKGIADARKNEPQMRKEDLTRSLSDFK